MSTSIFSDKLIKPDEQKLTTALANTYKLWEEIRKYIRSEFGETVEEWKYYNSKSGWILKSFYKKRNLFFFTPCEEYFRISFAYGEKAVTEIEKSDLPESIIEEIKNARKYMEGKGLRVEVKNRKDVDIIKKLVDIKIRN
jgi:hypothetical protein